MTTQEIAEDYHFQVSQDTGLSDPGQCVGAARRAHDFFCSHPLMRPVIVDCVMISNAVVKLTNGLIPTERGSVSGLKKSFTFEPPCIWREGGFSILPKSSGSAHRVVAVLVADGSIVLVDWSAGQFDNLQNTLLYVL